MTTAEFHVGDVTDVMATLEPGSVDLVMTSPPFLALRSYLPPDHPDKHREIGSEATPADFLDTLLGLTAAWGDLLAPHGSICVELGDKYSGSGGAGGDYSDGGLRDGQPRFGKTGGVGWPLAKSMCLIPQAYALSLAYGRNVLTGAESPAGVWRVRNVVSWVRPNPPVGSLGDKYRPATSWLTIACRATDRWFDLDAVRTPLSEPDRVQRRVKGSSRDDGWGRPEDGIVQNPGGAPPLDWWKISTKPYKGSHYAAYPEALCDIPIRSMCPRSVCTTCGQPRRRIIGPATYVDNAGRPASMDMSRDRLGDPAARQFAPSGQDNSAHRITETLGWTDCGHDTWRPGLVLDPFAGSGTTLAVALGLGRRSIGIDLDERNVELAMDRVGPLLLDVIHHNRQEATT